MVTDDIFAFIRTQVRSALELEEGRLPFGIISLEDAIIDGRWWIIDNRATTLHRYSQLWGAALLMSAYGLYIDPRRDLIDVDCCYARVPRSAAIPVGPDDQWVLTYCVFCPEGQDWLASRPIDFEDDDADDW